MNLYPCRVVLRSVCHWSILAIFLIGNSMSPVTVKQPPGTCISRSSFSNYRWYNINKANLRAYYLGYFVEGDMYPNSKGHGANMGPTWDRQDPGWPHVGHLNLAIWVYFPANILGKIILDHIDALNLDCRNDCQHVAMQPRNTPGVWLKKEFADANTFGLLIYHIYHQSQAHYHFSLT